VNVLTVLIFASQHQVKEARNAYINFLLVRKTALCIRVFTFTERVVDAGFVPQVMGKPALVSLRTVVLIIQFAAHIFSRLRLDNIPLDRVRK
jgi:hypothetical protein